MTRQRRSHLIILALVPVLVFAAVRCADSPAPLPTAVPTASAPSAGLTARIAKLHEETDWIGKYHNEALQYVYTSLSHLPFKGRNNHTICEAARRAYAEFHSSRRGTPVPASVDAQFEGFCATGAGPTRFAVLDAPAAKPRAEVSADAQVLMDQIGSAIDASTSFEDLNSRVSSIESSAASALSYDEAEDVFTVGSIALNSATYWANNLTDWVPFTNTAEYSRLLTTRVVPPGGNFSPAFNNGDDSGGFSWSSWAGEVWRDTKAAAKRAAGGDVHAAMKALLSSAMAEAPIVYEIVISSAAVGSISAVLML